MMDRDNNAVVPDFFGQIMEFVSKHELQPSQALQNEYAESHFVSSIKFPEFDLLKKNLGFTNKMYNVLKKVHETRGKFKFLLNLQTPVQTIWSSNKYVYIGTKRPGTIDSEGAALVIHNGGSMYEGYYSNNKKNFWCRYVWNDGKVYEGQCVDNIIEGKGEKTY
mmetsp:Transcript_18990/g.21835  ORF Transcript_18990/g.21835 Transcript_18990/m.21835 type:complete len:164 (-) Transcript_18990:113-604(-)